MEHDIRASPDSPVFIMSGSTGGTGSRFARAVTIVAGVAALVATILTFLYVPSPYIPALLLASIANSIPPDRHGFKGTPYREQP